MIRQQYINYHNACAFPPTNWADKTPIVGGVPAPRLYKAK